MATILAWFALLLVILTVGSCLLTVWMQVTARDDLLKLTEIILSWQIVAGGLAVGTGVRFGAEISALLVRMAGGPQ